MKVASEALFHNETNKMLSFPPFLLKPLKQRNLHFFFLSDKHYGSKQPTKAWFLFLVL